MRIHPHLQDSGGFFVAVLEKEQRSLETEFQTRWGDSFFFNLLYLHISLARSREKKREAKDFGQGPKTKRSRLDDEVELGENVEEFVPTTMGDVSLEAKDVTPVEGVTTDAARRTEYDSTRGQDDSQAGPVSVRSTCNESFKENPYTFLPADDPILVSCMYVVRK